MRELRVRESEMIPERFNIRPLTSPRFGTPNSDLRSSDAYNGSGVWRGIEKWIVALTVSRELNYSCARGGCRRRWKFYELMLREIWRWLDSNVLLQQERISRLFPYYYIKQLNFVTSFGAQQYFFPIKEQCHQIQFLFLREKMILISVRFSVIMKVGKDVCLIFYFFETLLATSWYNEHPAAFDGMCVVQVAAINHEFHL